MEKGEETKEEGNKDRITDGEGKGGESGETEKSGILETRAEFLSAAALEMAEDEIMKEEKVKFQKVLIERLTREGKTILEKGRYAFVGERAELATVIAFDDRTGRYIAQTKSGKVSFRHS